VPADPRRRLLVLNQYYWPGVEATAQLLTELCEELAQELDMEVVTGVLHGHEDEPRHLMRNGVEIVRVASTSFERSKIGARAANYVTYLSSALAAGLHGPRPDAVLCMTDPPIVADVALVVARRFRVPLIVISQDVFPEIAVQLKRLENPAVMRILRLLVSLYLRRADHVVAIGDTMRRRLEEKGVRHERIHVIPNWVDTERLQPVPRDNDWARSAGLDRRFVVMHSGNVGHAQDLDSLIRAGTFLRDLDDLVITVIGMGARHAELVASRAAARGRCRDVPLLPAAPSAGAVAVGCGRPRRRPRAGAGGLRGSEPALRDPGRGAPGDRGGRYRERDGAGGRGGRLRDRRPARPAGALGAGRRYRELLGRSALRGLPS
jgi:colanic acid biosynthesis glycosyl transferase WcaI